MTPLRQRFIDDLRLKNFSAGTIKVYVHAVERFARFLGRSPEDATAEDARRFLVGEIDRGVSRSYSVIQRNALRHLFQDTRHESNASWRHNRRDRDRCEFSDFLRDGGCIDFGNLCSTVARVGETDRSDFAGERN
ncbi:MAG: phage integrase N-terminal SAM-like domain-containing protein [Planctomycetes bacterium]|nr:phage integrase N-terminal SAM-like domain-containing protein [Planctomycetota bacterium]